MFLFLGGVFQSFFFLGIFFIKDEIEVGIIYCLWGTFVG
jgi:hypothetical protein